MLPVTLNSANIERLWHQARRDHVWQFKEMIPVCVDGEQTGVLLKPTSVEELNARQAPHQQTL